MESQRLLTIPINICEPSAQNTRRLLYLVYHLGSKQPARTTSMVSDLPTRL